MSELLKHLNANAEPPAPMTPIEPTLAELEDLLAADPENGELRAYVEQIRSASAPQPAPQPTRLADLPPPLAVDLQPARPPVPGPSAEFVDVVAAPSPAVPLTPAKRGRKPKAEAPAAPTYDARAAAREMVVIECIRAGKSVDDACEWLALLDRNTPGGES